MMHKRYLILLLTLLLAQNITAQEYSLDITGLRSGEYNLGEELTFTVLLIQGEEQIEKTIQITLEDALETKKIEKEITTNKEITIPIELEYPSGLWTIKATYEDYSVDRSFVVGQNEEVRFSIEGDELIITNTGNTRYTRTILITIGEVSNSYVQNIGVGEEKRLKLLSPEGAYDIEVTDGLNTITRKNIELFGTGNVIGAVDQKLVGYTGFAGANEIATSGERQAPLTKLPVSLTFIAAVFILGILVFTERKLTKKKKRR
jgi:hypothetical protein